MTILRGVSVRLRPATLDDVPELAGIRATPEVHRHWRGGDNMVAAVLEDFREQDSTAYAIELNGHHRLTIDPAADNPAAIRAYTKVGFRPVGVQRRAERGADGTWHDSLLMDLLAEELTDSDDPDPP
jgi:aminoglycoside 6'-N-acetyltransferase